MMSDHNRDRLDHLLLNLLLRLMPTTHLLAMRHAEWADADLIVVIDGIVNSRVLKTLNRCPTAYLDRKNAR